MTHQRIILVLIAATLMGALIHASQLAGPGQVIETGKITLHMMQNPIGEERYELKRDASGLRLDAQFEYTDRGTKIPMTASLQMKSDLTPESFRISGKSYRPFT